MFLTLPYVSKVSIGISTVSLYKTTDEYISAEYLWVTCSWSLMYLNKSVNFLLYCISGNTFKEEFLVLCGCHRRLTAREKVIEQARKDR